MESAVTNIAYSIIAALIVRFFDYLLKPRLKSVYSDSKLNFTKIGDMGCLGSLISVIAFALIYVFRIFDEIVSVQTLTTSFLICYGVFLMFHLSHGLIRIFRREGHLSELLGGISFMVFFTSIAMIILFAIKLIWEMQSGISSQEINDANKEFVPYLILLIRAAFFSLVFKFISDIIGLLIQRSITNA